MWVRLGLTLIEVSELSLRLRILQGLRLMPGLRLMHGLRLVQGLRLEQHISHAVSDSHRPPWLGIGSGP